MDSQVAHTKTPPSRLSVIILEWNQPLLTTKCVESVLKSDYAPYEIVIVDNGSQRENYDLLCRQLKSFSVSILRNTCNEGFSKGNNIGIEYALKKGADYILLLNNDSTIHPEMPGLMVKFLDEHPEVGIAGPTIYYHNEPTRVWFAGYRFKLPVFLMRRGKILKANPEGILDVDFVNGCGMMIRREVLGQIGGLPEAYFMYYEDLEYCLRAKKQGWKVVCLLFARMWHRVSESYGGANAVRKEIHQLKSSIIFFRRNTGGLIFILNIVLRFLQAMLKVVWGIIDILVRETRGLVTRSD